MVGTWLSIATPVCLTLTFVGLVLSVIAWRRRGARSGLRGIAWSLLPLAAWLTHSAHMLGQVGSAIERFAQGFVFSPMTWLGVIVFALAVVLFLGSGGIPLLRSRKRKKDKGKSDKGQGQPASTAPAVREPGREKRAVAPAQDDDLADVRDILKRHGIS